MAGGSVSSRTRSPRPSAGKAKAAGLIRIPRNAKIRLGHTHPPGALDLFPPRPRPLLLSFSAKRARNFVRKRQSGELWCACMEIMEMMMMMMELEMG